jgi:acetyl esterase/lipase
MDHSVPDIQRAIRTARSRASEWGVDPDHAGIMGFSAGGMLVGLAGTGHDDPAANPEGEIDNLIARPAFQALIYGAPFVGRRAANAVLTEDTPPVFLATGGSDKIVSNSADVYKALVEAGVDTEFHVYACIGHGLAVQRSNPPGVAGWLDLFREWQFSKGLLQRK